MNWATAIVLLVVTALVLVAIFSLRKGKGGSSCCDNKKSSCSGCSVDCPFRN